MPEPVAAAARPIVWVPRSLAIGAGVGLTKLQRLIYLVLADRADNRDRTWRWNANDVATRTGVKDQRTVRAALAALVDSGLVEVVSPEPRRTVVRVLPVRPNGRLEVPLAAIWEGSEGPPRFDRNPAGAFSALLAILYFAGFETRRTIIRQGTLAEKAGCERRQMVRDLADLRDGLSDKVIIESPTRYEGRWGATEYTLVWENLPLYLTRNEIAMQAREADGRVAEVVDFDTARRGNADMIVDGLKNILVAAGLPEGRLDRERSAWIETVDAMVDDGSTAEQVIDVIAWSTSNDFWKANIRGMSDIRRHFTTITLRAEFQAWAQQHGRGEWGFTESVAEPTAYPARQMYTAADYRRAAGEE